MERGETLEHVAIGAGCPVDALKRENKRASALLHPGDVLVIK